ncbi:SRPBCC domain-containing protein [bacterium]|nr:SRPBCC domain-containing protein [bacterium]
MESSMQEMTVELERMVMAPASRVWSILSTEDGMKSWLGPKNFEAREGGRVLFDVTHDGTRWLMFGNVLELSENRRIRFSWQEFDTGTLLAWPHPTIVTVTLEEREGGCNIQLRHSGFEKLPNAAAELEGYVTGWTSRDVLAGLAALVEQA